jgi:hypothetical protein
VVLKKITLFTLLATTFTANANFYIDMQTVESTSKTPQAVAGYHLLTGEYFGKIYQIGTPRPVPIVNSEGDDMRIADAFYMVLPNGWYAYVDEQVNALPLISWASNGGDFLDVLAKVGLDYGMTFVVDWEQSLVQIEVDENFTKPNTSTPIIVSDSDGDKEVYLYTKPSRMSGYIIENGTLQPVVVSQ